MTLQHCSEAARREAAGAEWRARFGQRVVTTAGAALIAGACAACSDAGGAADPTPFPDAGAGGRSTTAMAGAGGAAVLAGQGGSSGQPSMPDNLLGSPGLIDEPEPEPEVPVPAFPQAPSCAGSEPDACEGESCCLREPVATVELMRVATNVTVQLSAYQLDKFEVSVGRFRKFVDAFDDWRDARNPESGSGAHPYTPGSGWDRDPTWEVALPGSAAVMRVGLNCNATQQTWTDEPTFNEQKPVNCVSWYEAFAFCVWDEGRLPSEAEWQYAAVGGAQARTFAWGNTPLDETFASYACLGAGTGSSCTSDDVPDVGTHPNGDGLYGHADLVGSVYEWTLDWFADYPELMRDDYAKTDSGTLRVLRGGAWSSTTTQAMLGTDRSFRAPPSARSPTTGVRCARAADEVLY